MHKHLVDVYTKKRYTPLFSIIYQKHWNRKICQLASIKPGELVLDLGCGTGILFPELIELGCRVVGLDVSIDMLQAAGKHTQRISKICADAIRMPFLNESFNTVICRGSIHHLPNLPDAFRGISNVLKVNGCLVFSEPSNDSLMNRIARRKMYSSSSEFHEKDEGFLRQEICPMLAENGFEIEFSQGFGFFAYVFSGFPDKFNLLNKVPGACTITKILIALDTILARTPFINRLGLHWMVAARKT